MKNNSLIKYILITLAVSFIVNIGVYEGSKLITSGWHHTDMTTPLDLMIPAVPCTIAIYVASYLVWLIFYFIVALGTKEDREAQAAGILEGAGGFERDRFFAADALSRFICLIFFLILPTTLVRPIPGNETIWELALSLIYMADTPDNLFPSIHCLASWFCWIGVRNRRDLHPAVRYLALVLAILICISTVTTKQHVIVDIFAGIFLAEFCYWVAGFDAVRNLYAGPMKKLLK